MQAGKQYLLTLQHNPTIQVKMGWATLRDDENNYAVDVKDLTVSSQFTAAHVVALAQNPFDENRVPASLKLVVNNRDNTQPGEAIQVTRITALAERQQATS